ncbi:UNVERIFIED_CONTAM: hypothetical protein PYX00_003908 [Menopon gallinae]|uniref:Dynamin GTPase n=1 Tax=Menopon gallinae TaxID=328185 RepID=A0AAW2I235_9NEOP
MDSLIPIINKLQNVFHLIGEQDALSLPQIVVVGDQSSGKSSVIENILGKSFLPKGVGIITRQPLILQLINASEDDKCGGEDFGVFQHKKNIIFKNFNDIRAEIESVTNNKVGRNKEISDEPICLSIYSKNVLNLTLIDLPGLTKIPVGNQPPDIEARIKRLVTKYISNPNSIILAVVTANTDMTTSESLKLAREFDQDGDRTIAVVTKLDIMDSGTDATDILTGKIIPVKLGIVGVVNRSQKDTMANKSISDSIRDEATFLQKRYPALASKHGTPYLTQRLNNILKIHIKKCLPELKLRVGNVKAQTLAMLDVFGDDLVDGSRALLHVISTFCTAYCAALDGTSRQIDTRKLSGGARICYIFHETFGKTLDYIQPLTGLSKYDILTAMRNSTGTRCGLFVPEACFELLVKRQIVRLLEPSLKCVELIHDEMQQILQNLWSESCREMVRFPRLFEKIISVASDIITRRVSETNEMIENIIKIEMTYINTMHPEFRRSADISMLLYSDKRKKQSEKTEEVISDTKPQKIKVPSPTPSTSISDRVDFPNNVLSLGWFMSFLPVNYFSRLPGNIIPSSIQLKTSKNALQDINTLHPLNDRDKVECEVIERLVSQYFNITKKSIQDKVPKVIMHFMVNFVKENLQRELIEVLYKTEQDESLLQEPEPIKYHRAEQKYILKTLEDVDVLINELRDTIV